MADALTTGLTYKMWLTGQPAPQTVTYAFFRRQLFLEGYTDVNDALANCIADGGFIRAPGGIYWAVLNSPSLQPCVPGPGSGLTHGSASTPEVVLSGSSPNSNTVVHGKHASTKG